MYSWTLDEYIEAVSDQTFYDKVAVMLDATNDWDVNGDGDDDDDEYTKTLSQEEQKLRLLHLKFYYADDSIKEEFEVGDKVVVGMPNIIGNLSWVQPVDWNQAGVTVYFDTKANKVIFIR
ncbi:hypothetical protein PF005_g23491 [Phytophthora fragariae]|uniref:Uncharacterized protein n=1 Tax=Phytophthora fragariae TaxID=53985 RepID=A0A6A3H482_9STRA|nr:hypothetical protein PF003_g3691 [Phytophthora fragariae]KAE8925574.1 hypothetical protein PF009_g24218 [Phytophthora fragariae]KAE8963872.1 hypothetical protein PF011_g28876 [Phytophthora fragariae]KAE9065809.1 hypothetical protein PF010_g28058 [Phytophthora fragariae]KAE9164035.1 hypothetical protein PF004_g29963 [Phytophthora fragariae]